MPRAITRRCRGIAKASVNICRHHAFPATFPFFTLLPSPRQTPNPFAIPSEAAGEARTEAWRCFGGRVIRMALVGAGSAVLGLLAAFLIMGQDDTR